MLVGVNIKNIIPTCADGNFAVYLIGTIEIGNPFGAENLISGSDGLT